MMRILSILCFSLWLCGLPELGVAGGPVDWQQMKDVDGVKVFVATAPEDPIVKVRTEVVLDADIQRIVTILDDEPGRVQWVPYLAESRRLQVFSPSERLVYNRFAAPWPAADRDLVFRVTKTHEDPGRVVYAMRSEASALMPEQPGLVRALLLESAYSLTDLGGGQTRFELVFHADPRGWVPLWIVNILHRTFPFRVLKGLREQLGEARPIATPEP